MQKYARILPITTPPSYGCTYTWRSRQTHPQPGGKRMLRKFTTFHGKVIASLLKNCSIVNSHSWSEPSDQNKLVSPTTRQGFISQRSAPYHLCVEMFLRDFNFSTLSFTQIMKKSYKSKPTTAAGRLLPYANCMDWLSGKSPPVSLSPSKFLPEFGKLTWEMKVILRIHRCKGEQIQFSPRMLQQHPMCTFPSLWMKIK